MKLIILFVSSLILCISCKNDDDQNLNKPDCSTVLCASLELRIELIDKTDNSNYIDKNKLDINNFDIIFKDAPNRNPPAIVLSKDENGESIIILSVIDMASIIVNDQENTSITMEVSKPKTNNCCDLGQIEKADSTSHDSLYNFDSNRLMVKI